MIIIFNISGLLVALAGVGMWVAVTAVTGRPGIGMLVGSLTLIALGFWWRSRPTGRGTHTGQRTKNAYPALFFIPLPFAGILFSLLSLPAVYFELKGKAPSDDPRYAQFEAVDDQLKSPTLGGDAALSGIVHKAITAADPSSTVSVNTRVEKDRVLVLAKISKLKDYDQASRQALLDRVLKAVNDSPTGKGKSVFVGIKGKLIYGIVHVPPNVTKIGETVPKELLYDFYGSAQPVAQAIPTASPTPTTTN